MSGPRIIGIIGPPCSGKSTVARIVESNGGIWINADTIAKQQLLEPEVVAELVDRFGPSVQLPDGTLSRPAIADLVFGDDAESIRRLEELESIVHPRTRREITKQIERASNDEATVVVLDVPLLIESGWDQECDEVWCLKIAPDRQSKLLATRGWDAVELERRQRRQLSWEAKQQSATTVIANDGSIADLEAKIINLLSN